MTSIGVRQGYSQLVQNGYGQEAKKKTAKKTEEQTRIAAEQEGVTYEKTIPDSVSAGLGFIKEMEQQNDGTKFHIGTVSYGQTYGDSSSVNFVVNPKFLEKLGSDAEARKQFEESESTVSEKENETEKIRNSEEEGNKISGRVGVNVGKLARKIAAAKTVEQLRAVMAEIQSDMQEVKAGLAKGMCDESEVKKVEALMTMAKNRMGEVEDREATPEEESMFAMASLL